MSTLVIIVLVCCWNWIEFEKFQSFWKKMCVNLPNKWVKLHISTQILQENALFSGKNYTAGKIYTTAGRDKFQVWVLRAYFIFELCRKIWGVEILSCGYLILVVLGPRGICIFPDREIGWKSNGGEGGRLFRHLILPYLSLIQIKN